MQGLSYYTLALDFALIFITGQRDKPFEFYSVSVKIFFMYQMYKIIVHVNTSNVNTLLMYSFPDNSVILFFF